MATRSARGAGGVIIMVLAVLAAVLIGAADSSGAVPTVRPGQLVPVTASGFASRAVVGVRLVGSRRVVTVRADGRGRVVTSYRAPRRSGRYRLVLVGAPRPGRRPAPPRVRGPGDHQAVAVTVPRLVGFAFVVRGPGRSTPTSGPGRGSGGIGGGTTSSPPPPGAGAAPGGSGGTAVTGMDLALLLGVGVVVLGTGSVVATAARRRRPVG